MGDGIGAGRLAGKGKAMAAVAMIAAGAATIAIGGFGDSTVNNADPAPSTTSIATSGASTSTSAAIGTTSPPATSVAETAGTSPPLTSTTAVTPSTTSAVPFVLPSSTEATAATAPNTRLGALRHQLASLGVADLTAPRPAYDRSEYQPGGWPDPDGDCQNDRHEVLQRDSLGPVTFDSSGCHVVTGTWLDPYDGTTWTNSSDVNIDHFVPIAHANRVGAWRWDLATKQAFADDMVDRAALLVVGSAINEKKSDKGPADWKPPDESRWCRYGGDWIDELTRWHLPLESEAERSALSTMLDRCDTAGSQPLRDEIPPLALVTTSTTTIPPATSIASSGPATAVLVGCAKREETVTIANSGAAPIDISGWVLHDRGPNHTFAFPSGTTIPPGATLTVLTGPGAATVGPGEIAWKTSNVWNNSGDTAHLIDNGGAEQILDCT